MGEIAQVIGGGTPKTNDPSNFDAGNIPWITPADLSGYSSKYISRGNRNITDKGLSSSSARLLPPGTVLFTSRAPIGYVAIASNPIATNQGFKSFVLKEGVSPEYVYWWLKGSKRRAEELASGTTFLELSGANAKKLPIPIVPRERQHEIVAEIEKQFSRLDEAVAGLQRVKANLKRYKAAVLKSAVTGRLVRTEADWRSERLSVVANVIDPHPSHRTPATFSNGIPYVGIGDFTDQGEVARESARKISPDVLGEHRSRYQLEEGDFVFGKIGTIGRPVLLTKPFDYALSANVVLIQPNRRVIHPEFLLAFMASPHMSGLVSREARATTQAAFGIKRIRELDIPLPCLPEQYRIVAEVDRLLSIAREVESEVDANLKRAQGLRQAILAALFVKQTEPN